MCYSSDTIDRIIQDFKAQSELRSSSGSAYAKYMTNSDEANQKDYPTKRTFKIQHDYAISTSLLLNDLQAYADLLAKFRKRNHQYFNLTEKELESAALEQQIKTVSSSSCTSDSEDDGKRSESAEMQNEVPVDPQLTRCFECLQLIDDFRYRNDAALIDELMMRWNDPSDDYESSEPYEED